MSSSRVSLLDRIMLGIARFKIVHKAELLDNVEIFTAEKNGEPMLVYKFSYPGNVQYHHIRGDEVEHFLDVSRRVYQDLENMRARRSQ